MTISPCPNYGRALALLILIGLSATANSGMVNQVDVYTISGDNNVVEETTHAETNVDTVIAPYNKGYSYHRTGSVIADVPKGKIKLLSGIDSYQLEPGGTGGVGYAQSQGTIISTVAVEDLSLDRNGEIRAITHVSGLIDGDPVYINDNITGLITFSQNLSLYNALDQKLSSNQGVWHYKYSEFYYWELEQRNGYVFPWSSVSLSNFDTLYVDHNTFALEFDVTSIVTEAMAPYDFDDVAYATLTLSLGAIGASTTSLIMDFSHTTTTTLETQNVALAPTGASDAIIGSQPETPAAPAPTPSALALLATGLLGIGFKVKHRTLLARRV